MDYQKFHKELSQLYKQWGKASALPLTEIYNEINHQIAANSSTSIMQLLNWALQCMSEEEVFCQIDGITASDVIGALINHPQIAYLVAQPTDNQQQSEALFELTSAVSLYNLDEQIILTEQPAAEFFRELRQISPETKIGVYVYAGAHDYRSQLLALHLVKPLLAPQALIIAFGSKYSTVQQAHWDFLATTPQASLLLELPATVHNTWGEGVQIFSWDIEQDHSYDAGLTENIRSQIVIEALINTYEQLELQTLPERLLNLEQQALQLEINQQFIPAVEIYQQIIQLQPNHADAYYHLAMINEQMQRYSQAHEMLLKSISIDDTQAEYHYSLGLVSQQLGLIEQAIDAYQTAISLNTQDVDAYNNLGNLLCEIGNIQQAELVYRNAIANVPQHFGSYLNLGNLFMNQQLVDAAIAVYESALQFHPDNQDILHNLGIAFESKKEPAKSAFYLGKSAYCQGNYQEAVIYYQKFLTYQPGDISFYIHLAQCYKKLNLEEQAIQIYSTAIKYYPQSYELYLKWLIDLENCGRINEADVVVKQASQFLPNNLALQIHTAMLLPIIYENYQDINLSREGFHKKLEAVIQQTRLDSVEDIDEAYKAIGHQTIFYLSYQCQNDLYLQKLYGNFVHKVIHSKYPQWCKQLKIPALGVREKIRIGYFSAYMRNHNGAKWVLGWIKNCNKQKFDVYCYYTQNKYDEVTDQLQKCSDSFYQITEDLELVVKQILADNLHILVFTDIGMEPSTTQIAGLRLAYVQCTAWGHPVTSGLPTIDYYLSSELMEPDNAQEHYSEKLVLLPNIGICYPKPELPVNRKQRSEFGLKDEDIVYLSCQSLYKYLPQYDRIFALIARSVSQARFVFISSPISESITNKFKRRLGKVFADVGLNGEEYCVFLPRLSDHRDYLNVNLISDVYLDTLGWSGGNTTLEAIACNLPIVTCPGEFMRGRHSYGILKMLGVTETIATDEAEYIEIAVRLGLDPKWRQTMANQVKQNQHRVFEDQTCVDALEEFYQRVVYEQLQ